MAPTHARRWNANCFTQPPRESSFADGLMNWGGVAMYSKTTVYFLLALTFLSACADNKSSADKQKFEGQWILNGYRGTRADGRSYDTTGTFDVNGDVSLFPDPS